MQFNHSQDPQVEMFKWEALPARGVFWFRENLILSTWINSTLLSLYIEMWFLQLCLCTSVEVTGWQDPMNDPVWWQPRSSLTFSVPITCFPSLPCIHLLLSISICEFLSLSFFLTVSLILSLSWFIKCVGTNSQVNLTCQIHAYHIAKPCNHEMCLLCPPSVLFARLLSLRSDFLCGTISPDFRQELLSQLPMVLHYRRKKQVLGDMIYLRLF